MSGVGLLPLREALEAQESGSRQVWVITVKQANHGQDAAADTVLRDWDDFVAFRDFPQEHWVHRRTSNAIESVFAGLRLRTDGAKRMRKRENALYLVFKIVGRLGHNWRAPGGGRTIMTLLLDGQRFRHGIMEGMPPEAAQAA